MTPQWIFYTVSIPLEFARAALFGFFRTLDSVFLKDDRGLDIPIATV
jgi:hypothetical protein